MKQRSCQGSGMRCFSLVKLVKEDRGPCSAPLLPGRSGHPSFSAPGNKIISIPSCRPSLKGEAPSIQLCVVGPAQVSGHECSVNAC